MSYELKSRHLATVFIEADEIVPDSNIVNDLIKRLADSAFLPNVIPEVTVLGQKQRIGFRTLDGQFHLFLRGDRFDFVELPPNSKTALGDFEAFCSMAADKLAGPLEYFGKKGHRLAAVQEGFLRQLSRDEMDEIANRLLHIPDFYKGPFLFEWDWRIAALIEREISGIAERTNTITNVRRSTGHIILGQQEGNLTQLDRIRVDFDINTNPGNTEQRFGASQLRNFLAQAPGWHRELSENFFAFMLR